MADEAKEREMTLGPGDGIGIDLLANEGETILVLKRGADGKISIPCIMGMEPGTPLGAQKTLVAEICRQTIAHIEGRRLES